MRRIGFLIVSLALTVALFGCGLWATKIRTRPEETFAVSFDRVWYPLISILKEDREPILLEDKEKGLVSTDWVIEKRLWRKKRYKYEIQVVSVTPRTTKVTIQTHREKYSEDMWEPELTTEKKANRLFKKIRKEHERAEKAAPPKEEEPGPARKPKAKVPESLRTPPIKEPEPAWFK